MQRLKYYVRVSAEDRSGFDEYLKRNSIQFFWLSTDVGPGNGSSMFSLNLTDEEASAMRLSFDLIGFLNFTRALDAQVARRTETVLK